MLDLTVDLQGLGASVLQMPGDVSDYDAVQAMAGGAIEQLGNVFGLVNIAGALMTSK